MTAAFVDANGIVLAMGAMKTFLSDAELVWHVIGLLNGLNAKGESRHLSLSQPVRTPSARSLT